MTAAATPLPSDAYRALRPNRSPIASGPTRPRLIAAIAGPSTQLAAACRVAAAATTGKIGHAAYPSAHIPIVATARPATSRSERAASTMAPPGICPISPTRPPIDSTRPISTWVHFCVVRYTAMKGPKPVCTSARKKMNQSSPRKLWRDGVDAGGSASGSGAGGATFSVSIGRSRRSRSIRSIECRDERANRISPPLRTKLQGLQTARCAEHDDRRILLVFRRRPHLLLGQFERDAVALVADAPEPQCIPVDHDFPAAYAQKTAEIDDGCAHLAGAIDDHVDDPPHILVRRAADIPSKHAMRIRSANDRDGGWRHAFFWGRHRGGGIWRRGVGTGLRHSGVIGSPGCDSRQRCKNDHHQRERTFGAHMASCSSKGHQFRVQSRRARCSQSSTAGARRPAGTNGDRQSKFDSSTLSGVPAFNARELSTPESGRAYAKLPATRHRRGDGPADRRSKNPVAVRAGSLR